MIGLWEWGQEHEQLRIYERLTSQSNIQCQYRDVEGLSDPRTRGGPSLEDLDWIIRDYSFYVRSFEYQNKKK